MDDDKSVINSNKNNGDNLNSSSINGSYSYSDNNIPSRNFNLNTSQKLSNLNDSFKTVDESNKESSQ